MIGLRWVKDEADPRVTYRQDEANEWTDITKQIVKIELLPAGQCLIELQHREPVMSPDKRSVLRWRFLENYEVGDG